MLKLLCAFIPFLCSEPRHDDPFRDELHKTSNRAVSRIESKYKASACGFGGGTMFGIQSSMLAFQINGPITIEQARAIIVNATEIYRDEINANKAIRPYLEEYPFPISRLDMVFYVRYPKNSKSLAVFGLFTPRNGPVTITYDEHDENQHLKTVFEEPYQKAQELLHEKNQ